MKSGSLEVLGFITLDDYLKAYGTDPFIYAEDDTNSVQTGIKSLDSKGQLGTFSNHDLEIVMNGSRKILIDSATGHAGVNTDTPGDAWDVDGNVRAKTDTGLVYNYAQSFAGSIVGSKADTNEGMIGTYSNHPLTIGINNSEVARFDTAGKLGINDQSPYSLLHVNYSDTGITPTDAHGLLLEGAGNIWTQFLVNAGEIAGLIFSDDTYNQAGYRYDHSTNKHKWHTVAGAGSFDMELSTALLKVTGDVHVTEDLTDGTYSLTVEEIYNGLFKNQDNIMINAFRIAVNGSLSQFNMIDSIVDEYEDESGVSEILTKLLLHFEGSDGTTSTEDDSSYQNVISFQGTAQIDTAQYKWGSSSILFDGDSDYIRVADSSNWDICASTSEDWTVDFWVKHADHSGTEFYIGHGYGGNFDNVWAIMHVDGSGIRFRVTDGGGEVINTGYGGEITDTDWHHVALCKVGTLYAIYVDGSQVNYTDDSSTKSTSGYLNIGSLGAFYLNGHMDEVRIIKSNIFGASPVVGLTDTITVPTSAHNTDSESYCLDYNSTDDYYSPRSNPNYKLLLNMNGADESTTFTDSTGNHSVTASGNAKLDTTQKKYGTASGEFDSSTSDSIYMADSNDWDMGSGLFTWGFWIRFNGTPTGQQCIVGQYVDGNNLMRLNWAPNRWEFQWGVSGNIDGFQRTWTPSADTWYYIEVCRGWGGNANDVAITVNGTILGTAYTRTYDFPNLGASLYIGQQGNSSSYFKGWLDDFFICKGICLNTSNFSAPTSERSILENMVLVSETFTAEAEADSTRFVGLLEDVDSITINTDLKIYASRDDGTTWSQITLSDEGDYDTSKRILTGTVDISGQPSGTSMKYKIETLNNKDLNFHASSLSWN